MPRNFDDDPNSPPNGQGPQIVGADDVEEAVASMLRIWGVYVTAGVLGQYRELLAGLPPAAVLDAVKRWLMHPPADRPARPHELRAMAEAYRPKTPAPVVDLEAHRRRATPAEIDEAFAALQIKDPHRPFVRELLAERARYKAAWADERQGRAGGAE